MIRHLLKRPAATSRLRAFAFIALAAIPMAGRASANARAPALRPDASASPVVVELYQSQGCSSCPPANANLNAIADRADVLPLSFAVTYWDRLGWKDTFARPQFTQRQWDYARVAGRGEVATPQMIINGRQTIVGNNRARLEAAITAARHMGGPPIGLVDGKVEVGASRGAKSSIIWLVRYDPRVNAVPIRAGENNGRTLPHRNIVRQLDALGTWSGQTQRYALPRSEAPSLRTAVFVQMGRGGPIVAAQRL